MEKDFQEDTDWMKIAKQTYTAFLVASEGRTYMDFEDFSSELKESWVRAAKTAVACYSFAEIGYS